ncbi:MAG: zinc ribbon domain-containing protein [Ruminococcus sp.]|nr:zinc ribbon domain-containing protein [Ruminococcus sp.]
MICLKCRKPMIAGEFRMELHSVNDGIYYSYPMATWYKDGKKYCETPQNKTLGFYCADCGVLVGAFEYTKPVNFIGRFDEDIDDKIDVLPVKRCLQCGAEIDIDYPRCPKCGYLYEAI